MYVHIDNASKTDSYCDHHYCYHHISPSGTGVAPFRSFIQHRVSQGYTDNMLVFGCRHRDADFLCRDEWETLSSTGKLTLLTAFSRDQV